MINKTEERDRRRTQTTCNKRALSWSMFGTRKKDEGKKRDTLPAEKEQDSVLERSISRRLGRVAHRPH